MDACFVFHLVHEGQVCSASHFQLFFTLFRAVAFERAEDGSCFLDHIREQSLRAQTDLETNLRKRIFGVFEDLGGAFADCPDNHFHLINGTHPHQNSALGVTRYNGGRVSGVEAGGIAGTAAGVVMNCWSDARVHGDIAGGLVGRLAASGGTVGYSHWRRTGDAPHDLSVMGEGPSPVACHAFAEAPGLLLDVPPEEAPRTLAQALKDVVDEAGSVFGIDPTPQTAMNRLAASSARKIVVQQMADPRGEAVALHPAVAFQPDGTARAAFAPASAPPRAFFRIRMDHVLP